MNEEITLTGYDLAEEVYHFLVNEIHENGNLEYTKGVLKLTLPQLFMENQLGILLQQIYHVVDRRFPIRYIDIPLQFKDEEGKYCFCFKIWHTG